VSSSTTSEQSIAYMTKTVKVGGNIVTLYSINGMTWLSRPEDLPSTMERLENSRITLNDPKGEGSATSPLQKPTREQFGPRGVRGAPPTRIVGDSAVGDDEEMGADGADEPDDHDDDAADSAPLAADEGDEGPDRARLSDDHDDVDEDDDEPREKAPPAPKKAAQTTAPKLKAAPVKGAAPVAKTKTKPQVAAKTKAAPAKKAAKAAPAKSVKKPTQAKKAASKKKR
jgi:hypothetical protein